MANVTLPRDADQLRSRLAPLFHTPGLQLILLFGSQATGKSRRDSDIDLGFLFDEPVDIVEVTNEVIKHLKTDSVDVVDLRRAGPLLKFSTARQGKVIFKKNHVPFISFTRSPSGCTQTRKSFGTLSSNRSGIS